jgi:hypothetical protein
MWHRKRAHDSPHQWLRAHLQAVAQQAFGAEEPA